MQQELEVTSNLNEGVINETMIQRLIPVAAEHVRDFFLLLFFYSSFSRSCLILYFG
jgi:hypothetical protein